MLLIKTITSRYASSSHEILQKFNHAIFNSVDGSKLDATVLCGDITNFSYKVFIDKHPELCIFAKLCFDHALWNPDRTAHYDLQRVENEYEIMKEVSSKTLGCIVTPLALWYVKHDGNNVKLLMTEWSQGNEQFGNQFIDGVVDPRIAPKIDSIKGFDPDFNELVKPCVEYLFEHRKALQKRQVKSRIQVIGLRHIVLVWVKML